MRIGGTATTKEERAANAEAVAARRRGGRLRGRARPRRGHGARATDGHRHRRRSCARSRDGVDSLAASQAAGELPAASTCCPDEAGDGDEGTAMLEILHDMAPGAELGFATAFTSDASASPTTSARCASRPAAT